MAYNASDISYYFLAETVEGVTPATGAAHKLDANSGGGPVWSRETLTSSMQRAKRTAGGVRQVGGAVGGSSDFHFKRSPATDLLLSSALSGKWVGNELKASDEDTSFTIVKEMKDAGVAVHQAFQGVQVSEMTLEVESLGNADATVNFIGFKHEAPGAFELNEDVVLTQASDTLGLAGLDVSVNVAALSGITARSFRLLVGHEREVKDAFGSAGGIGIGTSGARTVTFSVTFYREDFAPETVFSANPKTAITVNIGSGANGYTFTLPAAYASWPEESVDGSKLLVTVQFTASGDTVADTDLKITRTV